MVSPYSLKRYISKADEVLKSNDQSLAKQEVTEILSVFDSEYDGLHNQLDRYSYLRLKPAGDGLLSTIEPDHLKDLRLLRNRLQVELEKTEPQEIEHIRSIIFISHRTTDATVADMIKDFLVSTGIPNEKVFCSSLPGNDVNEKISPEVKQRLKEAAIIILILSDDYYKSAYCINEAGVAWYLDDVVSIPIGLPEIDHTKMVGFLNSDYKLRRLDNLDDVSYLYDCAHEQLQSEAVKVGVINRETQKLKDRYCTFVDEREISETSFEENEQKVKITSDIKENFESDNILLLADVVLLFATELGGIIDINKSIHGARYVIGNKYNMNASQDGEEIAKWDAVIELLKNKKFIEIDKKKGSHTYYRVRHEGYNQSKGFKESNQIDITDKTPKDVIMEFEDA